MHFLYFLKDAPMSVQLSEWGLSHVGTASAKITQRQVQMPHMGNGLMVTRGDADLCRGDATGQNQTWHKIPAKFAGGKDVWCGWWLDRIPNAVTLARPRQIEGDAMPMVGGEKWTVPTLRKFVESDRPWPVYSVRLPTILDYDSDGELSIGQVVPEYRTIWKRAIEVAEFLTDGATRDGQADLSWSELIEFAGQVLGINYHVSMFEVVKLGLITQEIAQEIVRKSLDFDGWRERIKNLQSRSQSSGTNSGSGGEHNNAETPASTAPQLPI